MNARKFAVVASLIFNLTSALGTAQQTQDQSNKTADPKMAPADFSGDHGLHMSPMYLLMRYRLWT